MSVLQPPDTQPESKNQSPSLQAFIIRRGHVGMPIKYLISNFRLMLSPNTPIHLKDKKTTRMEDYLESAAQMDISHIITFSTTQIGNYMRIIRLPQGPTIYFQLGSYTLMHDIASLQKNPQPYHHDQLCNPILILSGFNNPSKHLQLVASTFQNLFPSVNVERIHVKKVRRVVLIHYDSSTCEFQLRHYKIMLNMVGLNKGIKNLIMKKDISFSNFGDISDIVLQQFGSTDSDAEEIADSSRLFELPNRSSPQVFQGQKHAVRLTEYGPRMTFKLLKIEEGLNTGLVLYHVYLTKTDEDVLKLEQRKQERVVLKAERRKDQEERVKAKKSKENKKSAEDRNIQHATFEDESTSNGTKVWDDVEWYRQEVGKEPTPIEKEELLSSQPSQTQRQSYNVHWLGKKKRPSSSKDTNPPPSTHTRKSHTSKRQKK